MDLLRGEPEVEAGAEVSARLDAHGARGADVEPERLEEDGVRGLVARADDDRGDPAFAPDLERGHAPERQAAARVDPPPARDRPLAHRPHHGRGLESPGELRLPGRVELRVDGRADAGFVGAPREVRVEEGAVEDAARPRLDEGPQQPGGVPAAAPARIVARVGEDDGRAVRVVGPREGDRLLDRGEAPAVAGPLGPGARGDLAREGPCRRLVRPPGDDDRDPVLGRVSEHEPAEYRHVEDRAAVLALAALPVVDELPVRPRGGQQGDAGRGERKARQRPAGPHPGEHRPDRVRRLLAPLQHVHVRVRLVADHHVRRLDHLLGEVGVEVEGHDEGRAGADRRADAGEHLAVGVRGPGGHHGPVVGDVDRVERRARLEPGHDPLHGGGEEGVVDGTRGRTVGDDGGYRRPGAGRVEGPDGRGHLRRDDGGRAARLGEDLVALQVVAGVEVRPGRGRGEGVALERHPRERDPGRGPPRSLPVRHGSNLIPLQTPVTRSFL